jgi:hypothetical protein
MRVTRTDLARFVARAVHDDRWSRRFPDDRPMKYQGG